LEARSATARLEPGIEPAVAIGFIQVSAGAVDGQGFVVGVDGDEEGILSDLKSAFDDALARQQALLGDAASGALWTVVEERLRKSRPEPGWSLSPMTRWVGGYVFAAVGVAQQVRKNAPSCFLKWRSSSFTDHFCKVVAKRIVSQLTSTGESGRSSTSTSRVQVSFRPRDARS